MSFVWTNRVRQPAVILPWYHPSNLVFYDEYGKLVNINSLPIPPVILLKDENGNLIDAESAERPEQVISNFFIDADASVLELGARYGSVSCIINKKLNDKTKQVSVEPDKSVWSVLDSNIAENGCSIHLHKGFVANTPRALHSMGYASQSSSVEQSDTISLSVKELETNYQLKFDTLVADCEGFLETFFDENPFMYSQLKTVIFEADAPNICNYDIIRKTLKEHGFREIYHGFQNVYKK
jgi:hypothetical protein